MVTIEEFKKLIKLEGEGYHIFINGDEVHGLIYDEELDWTEYVDGSEEMRCTFTFTLDRYTTVQYLKDYQQGTWTVEKCEDVDWRNL